MTTVVVLGAAGGTGRLVVEHACAAGYLVRAGVRRPGSAAPLPAGANEVLADLTGTEESLRAALAGADAVICAAGGGPGAVAVDSDGVANAVAAAAAAGVGRFVLVSSMFADRPDVGPAFLREVLAAKRIGEYALTSSALEWTILRPGGLVDAPGTGLVTAAHSPDGTPGMLPRADLASTAVACLAAPATIGAGIDLVAGETLIATALAALAG